MNVLTDIFAIRQKDILAQKAKTKKQLETAVYALPLPARSMFFRMKAALEFVEQTDAVLPCAGCEGYLLIEDDETVDDSEDFYCHDDCMNEALSTRRARARGEY